MARVRLQKREEAAMHTSVLVPLLGLVAVLLVGVALLRLVRGKKPDHGARIARRHGHVRSPQWSSVATAHLVRQPRCVACGYHGKHLQVHHIKPFHLHPHLELDPDNLITLCQARGREHHLLLGHLDAWDSFNEHIHADVRHFHGKSARQIRADERWQKKRMQRP